MFKSENPILDYTKFYSELHFRPVVQTVVKIPAQTLFRGLSSPFSISFRSHLHIPWRKMVDMMIKLDECMCRMFLSRCSERTSGEKCFASHKGMQYQQADGWGSHGGDNSVASSRPLLTMQYAGPKIEASKTSCDAHLPFEKPDNSTEMHKEIHILKSITLFPPVSEACLWDFFGIQPALAEENCQSKEAKTQRLQLQRTWPDFCANNECRRTILSRHCVDDIDEVSSHEIKEEGCESQQNTNLTYSRRNPRPLYNSDLFSWKCNANEGLPRCLAFRLSQNLAASSETFDLYSGFQIDTNDLRALAAADARLGEIQMLLRSPVPQRAYVHRSSVQPVCEEILY